MAHKVNAQRGLGSIIGGLPHARFVLFLTVFVLGTGLASRFLSFREALILGFDLAALSFLLAAIGLWSEDAPAAARARAARDDGGRIVLMLVTGLVIMTILITLGLMIGGRQSLTSWDLAIVLSTLVLAWLFANLVYAFHYAHLYYDRGAAGDAGGIVFPEGGEPVFADFVYFAFVLGMTCQTADVAVASHRIRRVMTLHGLFAFFFNLGVLAMTINVLAGVL